MRTLENPEMLKLDKLKRYYQKCWQTQITPEELSIFEIKSGRNNAAGSCHSKIKSIIKISQPRICSFINTQNEIIKDADSDIACLLQGREISRPRKKEHIKNECRSLYKQRLIDGVYSPRALRSRSLRGLCSFVLGRCAALLVPWIIILGASRLDSSSATCIVLNYIL